MLICHAVLPFSISGFALGRPPVAPTRRNTVDLQVEAPSLCAAPWLLAATGYAG